MSRFRLEIAETAVSDILEQSRWYASRANPDLAARCESAVGSTLLFILDHPMAVAACGLQNPALRYPQNRRSRLKLASLWKSSRVEDLKGKSTLNFVALRPAFVTFSNFFWH